MLIKAIGASLIMVGTVGWGVTGILHLRTRATVLRDLTSSLDFMRAEICDRCTPMPILLGTLAKMYSSPVSQFYAKAAARLEDENTMFSSWKYAVEDSPELQLNDDESRTLSELGICLGKYEADEQRKAIEYTRSRIASFAEKASLEQSSESKLRAFLGLAAGIFSIMILL